MQSSISSTQYLFLRFLLLPVLCVTFHFAIVTLSASYPVIQVRLIEEYYFANVHKVFKDIFT